MPHKLWLAGITVLVLTLVGFKLRANDYREVPLPGQSTDEYSNAWVGMSLIQTGQPVGISGLTTYDIIDYRYLNPDHIYNNGSTTGDPMMISYPWLDHPPLMPLLVGGWTHLRGARVFEDVTAATVRQPALILGTLLIPLVFLLAFQEFGLLAGLLAAAAMAVSPLMVINSRMSQAEIALAPLFVGGLVLLNHYFSTKQRQWLWLAALCGGLAVLVKLSGIAVVLTLVLLLWSRKEKWADKWPQLLIVLSPALAGLLFYVAFGLSLDGEQFLRIFSANSARKYGIGLNAIYELLTQTRVTNLKYLADGWFLAGWLGLAALFSRTEGKTVKAAVLVYLAIYMLFGSEPYGWYRIPFQPFLLVALAAMVFDVVRDVTKLPLAIMALLIPLGVNLSRLYSASDLTVVSPFRWGHWLVIILGLLLALGESKKRYRWLVQLLIIGLVLAVLLTSLWYTQFLTPQNWLKVS